MQWLDWILITEASGGLVFSGWNCACFGWHARQAKLPARRVAALVLSLVNGALALEAGYYLAWSLPVSGLEQAALVVVRSALFGSGACISLLVWRHGARRRS